MTGAGLLGLTSPHVSFVAVNPRLHDLTGVDGPIAAGGRAQNPMTLSTEIPSNVEP
jgi:hypothetical protein